MPDVGAATLKAFPEQAEDAFASHGPAEKLRKVL